MSFRAQASTTFTMGLVMALASVSSICSGTDAASAEPVTAEPERYTLEHCGLAVTHNGSTTPWPHPHIMSFLACPHHSSVIDPTLSNHLATSA